MEKIENAIFKFKYLPLAQGSRLGRGEWLYHSQSGLHTCTQ